MSSLYKSLNQTEFSKKKGRKEINIKENSKGGTIFYSRDWRFT